ncbi:MAG: hypothetical protein WA610_06370 [Thermodesulfovibrionales bacterium]
MKFILLIFLFGVIVYFAIRMLSSIFGKPATPATPVLLQPTKTDIDISITDTGEDGMPVITIRSNGATLNIQSVKQDAGQYVVSAEKQADNVAVIFVDKKA